MKYLATILFLMLFSFPSFSYSQRERDIFKSIKCLACEGQSILGSGSEFAKSMRQAVHEHVESGKTDEEIYSIIRKGYGDEIFFDPPYEKATYLLWFLPFIIVFMGIFLVVFIQTKYKPKIDSN